MKKVKLEEIQAKSKEELLDDLKNCRYSLLDSLGCRRLRLEMFIPGLVSAIIVRYLVYKAKKNDGNNWTATVRRYLIQLFKKNAPYVKNKGETMPVNSGGIIIGFNHPSLGEILRLIALVSKDYPYDSYLFPVNLPWYEALCPVVDKMEEAGFKLTPIITPSTRKKIEKVAGTEKAQLADRINAGFNSVYLDLCRKFIRNGDVVVVAPSATRQRFIFKTDAELCQRARIEPQTMSLLASSLAREFKNTNAQFVPITVKPPHDFSRGLNLGSAYEFGISKSFSIAEAAELAKQKYGDFNGRMFDYLFLSRITEKMFRMYNHDLIAPLTEPWAMDGLAKILEDSKKVAR